MLGQMEEQRYPGEKTILGGSRVWLEHILPRNPEKNSPWLEVFPTERERRHQVNRLGNCTLLLARINEQARNRSFNQKRVYYATSEIQLTRQLVQWQSWGQASIDERSELLCSIAEELWPVYGSEPWPSLPQAQLVGSG